MTKLSQGSRAPAVRHQLPLESAEAAQLQALACAEKTNEMGRNLSLGLLSSSAKPSGGVCLKQTVAWSPLGAPIEGSARLRMSLPGHPRGGHSYIRFPGPGPAAVFF